MGVHCIEVYMTVSWSPFEGKVVGDSCAGVAGCCNRISASEDT